MTAPAQPKVRQRRRYTISWIWLVPLVAALVGVSLLVRGWLSVGPVVTISFETAAGLEAGQTKVRYKDVVVGVVTDIRVSADRTHALVDAQLNREGAQYFTQSAARYWVVRPRLGLSGVSGLGTLLSGAYISVDAPDKLDGAAPVYKFKGLEKPPEVSTDRAGRRYTLLTSDLSSLDIGSPVYYRRIRVGSVIGYDLAQDGRAVKLQVFIDAPYDRYVTSDTRFWNVSGIDLSLSASGVSVKTGSLAAVIAGGISFASANPFNTVQAPVDAEFALNSSEAQAMKDPDGQPFRVDMAFYQSVRGLKLGAPVDFHGMELGEVYDIDLEFDEEARRYYILVKTHLYPMRFGAAYETIRAGFSDLDQYPGGQLLAPMVRRGLRAQIQPASLLTGQQFIALDFFPDAPEVEFDEKQQPFQLPTVAGTFSRLQEQIGNIVAKLEAVPFEGIGKDLQANLGSMRKLLDNMNKSVTPELSGALRSARRSLDKVDTMLAQDSPLNENLDRVVREVSAAARSLRALSDFLQTHPSALIRGQAADVLPKP